MTATKNADLKSQFTIPVAALVQKQYGGRNKIVDLIRRDSISKNRRGKLIVK